MEKLCSKCGVNPRMDPEGTNPWCKDCQKKYNASAKVREDWRTERRGIVRGIQAMREHVSLYFRQYAGRPFMGNEVSSVTDSLPGPAVAPEDAKG